MTSWTTEHGLKWRGLSTQPHHIWREDQISVELLESRASKWQERDATTDSKNDINSYQNQNQIWKSLTHARFMPLTLSLRSISVCLLWSHAKLARFSLPHWAPPLDRPASFNLFFVFYSHHTISEAKRCKRCKRCKRNERLDVKLEPASNRSCGIFLTRLPWTLLFTRDFILLTTNIVERYQRKPVD